MFTREEDVEASALRKRGWTISAIARHLGRDRKTIRAYLDGDREPGQRRRAQDPFAPFEPYVRQRLNDDPHLQATTLERELRDLGFAQSYPTLTREIRGRSLRPRCEACSHLRGGVTTEIDHESGEETQWDWLTLQEAPWGGKVIVLVGALAHSDKVRGALSEGKGTPHLIDAVDRVVRRLGGVTKVWRFDRIEGGVIPGTDELVPAFADAVKHYGARVVLCPPRRPRRKGVIEAANRYLAQGWWRTAAVTSPFDAQRSLDRFCAETADQRPRGESTVAELARAEGLRPPPEHPYPAEIIEGRTVTWGALVHFEGNRYSVPAAFCGGHVVVQTRLGSGHLEIRTPSGQGIVRHRRHPKGAGAVVRLPEHRAGLEKTVLQAFSTARPCPRKPNRPPSAAALAIAAELRASSAAARGPGETREGGGQPAATRGSAPGVDLARYAELISP